MADTVSVGGKRVNKWVVYGGLGVAVVGGVLWWRSRSSASSSAATTATDTGSQIDPATNMTYADEIAQYGSAAAAEAAVGGGYGIGDTSGYGYSGLGYGYPADDYTTTDTSTPQTYVTNAQWAQAAEAGLTSLGYNAQTVGAAIGRYLASLPLTSDQVTIVQTAVAEYGNPPVGSYAIIAQPSSGGTASAGGGTQNLVTVPNTEGKSAGEAHNLIVAAGLVPVAPKGQTPNMKVSYTRPLWGDKVAKGTHVTIFTSGYVKK